MRLKAGILGLSFFFVSTPMAAKCPFVRYVAEGRLTLPSGVNASDVKLYLFLDGADQATAYPSEVSAGGQDFSVPAADGTYRVESWLSTISGYSMTGGERCDRVESGGDLFIVGRGFLAQRARVKFSQSDRVIRRSLQASGKLQHIDLTPWHY